MCIYPGGLTIPLYCRVATLSIAPYNLFFLTKQLGSYHNNIVLKGEMAGEDKFYRPCDQEFRDHRPFFTFFYIFLVYNHEFTPPTAEKT